jgi:glycosyltransferase involved in cell wall biosynthesis
LPVIEKHNVGGHSAISDILIAMKNMSFGGSRVAGRLRKAGNSPSALARSAWRVFRRDLIARKLQWCLRYRGVSTADHMFAGYLVQRAADGDAQQMLAGACLRAARASEARGRLIDAARLWLWHARAGGEANKAAQNIVRIARNTTRNRQGDKSVLEALEGWRCLLCLDPSSRDAQRGIGWCHATLASMAEQAEDFASARSNWMAVLQIEPDDRSASEGLQRLGDRGLAASDLGPSADAIRLYDRLKRSTDDQYVSLCTAGKLLLDAGAPKLAGEFLHKAFKQNAGGEAAILYFRSSAAIGDHENAARALAAAVQSSRLEPIPSDEMRRFLRENAAAGLPVGLLAAIAEMQGYDRGTALVLLPHLLARNLAAAVASLVDRLKPDGGTWPDALVTDAGQLLLQAGERDRALRLFAMFSNGPETALAFRDLARSYSPETVHALLSQDDLADVQSSTVILALAEALADSGSMAAATEVLCGANGWGTAQKLYRASKDRLCLLVLQILADAPADLQVRQGLADLVVSLLPPKVREFFATAASETLRSRLVRASHFDHAALGTREGIFREGYFEHHMERRENCRPEAIETDFEFCAVVLRYFQALSSLQPDEHIPISAALRARLATNGLAFGENSWADQLMSYAILLERPQGDLESPTLFATLGRWYARDFMLRHHVPPSCLARDVAAHFNAAQRVYPEIGLCVTRFADEIVSEIGMDEQYDTANALDVLLLGVSAVAELLPANLVCRPWLSAMMPPPIDREFSFVDLCIEAMRDKASYAPSAVPFTELLADTRDFATTSRIPTRALGLQPDILLIGHNGEGTGLNRNFRMLERALSGPDVALNTLSYELSAEEFADRLKAWRGACSSDPVVIAAINAQDIPALFVRDKHQVLEYSYMIGFFLWETSRVPRVQQLGIDLVNEVWTPTEYVARVYAPFADVHVVGKGLYASSAVPPRKIGGTGSFTFLTVFDFHSSIERKNPLACVLAFQRAFQSNEDVRLVLKSSNVNPQHPGNAFGQWERICQAAAADPRIRLITERYSEAQMADLLRETSCLVSLHRSEGFGYVLADAMALAVPVIATGYSGNADFCTDRTSFPVDYRLVPVRSAGAHWEDDCAEWAEPDLDSAAARMLEVYRNYPAALGRAATGQRLIFEKYSIEAFAATVQARVAEIRAAFSGASETQPLDNSVLRKAKTQWH